MVIGPTPPGTGVIAAAWAAHSAVAQSPTRRPSGRRLMPTSMTTLSFDTQSPRTISGRPAAATGGSARRPGGQVAGAGVGDGDGGVGVGQQGGHWFADQDEERPERSGRSVSGRQTNGLPADQRRRHRHRRPLPHPPDLAAECRRAGLLVAAAGRPEMVRGDWVSNDSVVIDVGINRLPDGRLVGDCATAECAAHAAAGSPRCRAEWVFR